MYMEGKVVWLYMHIINVNAMSLGFFYMAFGIKLEKHMFEVIMLLLLNFVPEMA